MMKSNELRIGNIIHNGFKPVAVQGVDGEGIILLMKCHGITYPEGPHRPQYEWEKVYLDFDQAAPIPLTEEWLMRLGFEKGYSLWINGSFALEWGDFSKCWQFPAGERRIDIKFIHQLQNLYFALTGEELTIKP